MALNGNLNGVLNNVCNNIAPVIKDSSGLYTTIQKDLITPSVTSGTNLEGNYLFDGDNYFTLLGTWAAFGADYYTYDANTHIWSHTIGIK